MLHSTVKHHLVEELLSRLTVEDLERDRFYGRRQNFRNGNVFGGQLIGQSLSAAYQTVSGERSVHSLHAYFVLPADPNCPLVYSVARLRDGASFTTRQVTAFQNETVVFTMLASFQTSAKGPDHQDEMPHVPKPEACSDVLPDQEKLLANVPEEIRQRILAEKPIEARYVHMGDPLTSPVGKYERCIWFRSAGPMPGNHLHHHLMLAYVSDYSLVATVLYRHGYSFWDKDIQVTSLDHAMWFHRDFRMDEWLLYAIHTPTASDARGLSVAHIFTQDGDLVATVAQEGLIRFAI